MFHRRTICLQAPCTWYRHDTRKWGFHTLTISLFGQDDLNRMFAEMGYFSRSWQQSEIVPWWKGGVTGTVGKGGCYLARTMGTSTGVPLLLELPALLPQETHCPQLLLNIWQGNPAPQRCRTQAT